MNSFLWGVYPYICITLFLVVPVIRMRMQPFTWSTRASGIFGAQVLGMASLSLHWGLFGLLVGHLAGFVGGLLGWESWVKFFFWVGLFAGFLALLGSVVALARRFHVAEVRAMSQIDDYVVHGFLVVIMSLALYQVVVDRLFGLAFTAAPWLASVIHLTPQAELMASASVITKLHIFLALTFFAYFPFTKLVHMWSYPIQYAVRPYQSMRTQRFVFDRRWDLNLDTDKSFLTYGLVTLVVGFVVLAGLRGRVASEQADTGGAWAVAGQPLMGERLYVSQCARCHGVDGQGAGLGAKSGTFTAPPRDLTAAKFHFVSTTNGVALDADLAHTVRHGLLIAGMPAFSDLSDVQVQSLVAYLRRLEAKPSQPGQAIAVAPPPTAPDTARGAQLFASQCATCHGTEGRGDGPLARTIRDFQDREVKPANLAAGQIKAGSEPEQIYTRIAAGIWGGKNGGPLMFSFASMPPQDIWAIVYYVREKILPPMVSQR